MTSEDAIRAEHQEQAAAQVSVANVIGSLRLCGTLDWSEYFETVSLVERVLQQDPAGVYGAHGLPEPRPLSAGGRGARRQERRCPDPGRPARGRERPPGRGERLDRGSRRARRPSPDRQGPSRSRERRRLSPAASPAPAPLRLRARHRLLPGLDRAPDPGADRRSAWRTRAPRARPVAGLAVVALLLLVPASDLAIAVVQRLVARLAPPRRLPRLDFTGAHPAGGAHAGGRSDAASRASPTSTSWSRASRCWRSPTWIPASTSASPATSPTRRRA